MIIISHIEVYISHDVPTDYFRNLIVQYPLGKYERNGSTNWFALVVKSDTFERNVTYTNTIKVTLTWFAGGDDESLMDDYHADPANYTP